ncbi:hypothetical protein ABZ070_13550 [Streptomyces sp. NPDC006283]|uniref:hypothetical protein n=1 Tax=Streptomyces sp. NPDC006283 TaxID=3156741 RepID=UPI0033B786F5
MTSTLMLLITPLVGCSRAETKSVPELPERICWDIFARKDVAPLLPTGEEATIDVDPFVLDESLDEPICSLYIDGNTKFQAFARYQNFEDGIDWSSYDPANPEPINVGKEAIVWHNGAASYISCEPSKSPSTPGKYIDLRLYTFGSPDDQTARKALPAMLKQFVAFAQRELKCP